LKVDTWTRAAAGLAFVLSPFAVWAVLAHPIMAEPFLPKCLFHETTGLYCPGCGGTRAVLCLTEGRILDAFHNNALWPLAAALVAYLWLSAGLFAWRGTRFRLSALNGRVAVAIVAAVIVFGFLRNLPFYPFTLLAPLEPSIGGKMQP